MGRLRYGCGYGVVLSGWPGAGTGHYFVLYSGTEIEGSVHSSDVIVATRINGKDFGDDGEIKLVASGDKKPMRWVRNLTKITLVTAN